MHHRFHFTASRFNTTEVRSHFTNDRCFGDDVVDWLRERFAAEAADADIGEPIQEDWGWGFWLELADERYWVYARLEVGESGSREWCVGLEINEPLFAWRPEARSRRQARYDTLVAMARRIIVSEAGQAIRAEEDD